MTFAFAEGLVIQTGCIHETGVAFLRVEVDVRAPVYVGDTIGVIVEVTEQRPTSKGDRGVITTRNEVINQRGEVVPGTRLCAWRRCRYAADLVVRCSAIPVGSPSPGGHRGATGCGVATS